MPVYITLLRGVNVSGQKLIKMAELQSHCASFGATGVRTYIQSGNIVFEHRATTSTALRTGFERYLASKLGYTVSAIVKSAKEFAAIAAENPFDTSAPEFGRHMYVCFFAKAPAPAAIESIRPFITNAEQLVVKNAAGYAYFANGLGRARLTSVIIERKLGLATLRNWNTVKALLDLAKT